MAGPLASVAPRSWLRLPRRTARLRLTLLYAGMFLVLGTAVIGAIYVLAASGESIESSASHGVTVVPSPSKAALARIPPSQLKLGTPKDLVDAQHNADLNRLLVGSWLVLAVTALASAGFGWFVAGRVLRPLREMTATAQTITAGNLGERLALAGPNDEFKRLGDTFDALLTRLQGSFEAQRRFVASASHELRTPLTLERTLLQVALADPDASTAIAARDLRGVARVEPRPGAAARGAADARLERARARAVASQSTSRRWQRVCWPAPKPKSSAMDCGWSRRSNRRRRPATRRWSNG